MGEKLELLNVASILAYSTRMLFEMGEMSTKNMMSTNGLL